MFYYYTFKKDGTEAGPFMIERNLVTFNPNGTVTIKVLDIEYEGNAYYLKNTLRLSMSSPVHGFLEAFFELIVDADLSEVKILYGMSLWRSGKRLQGKAVVLSRLELVPLSPKTEFFRFYDNRNKRFESENRKILDEDRRGGGVMSYLRGELNRYIHSPIQSSSTQFRPRDKSHREMHFFIACFYGFKIKQQWPDTKTSNENLIQICIDHLDQAFIHGYACDFAGIIIDAQSAISDDNYIKLKYLKKYKEAKINEKLTVDILERIKCIAQEKIFLIQAFQTNGPLDLSELKEHAKLSWKDLLKNI